MPKQRGRGVTDFLVAFKDVTTTFFDIETDLLVVLDADGDIERVNPVWVSILNRTEQECIGRPIIVFVLSDDFARFMRAFNSIKHSESFRLLHRDHGVISVKLVAYRFKKSADVQRGFLVMRPVKE